MGTDERWDHWHDIDYSCPDGTNKPEQVSVRVDGLCYVQLACLDSDEDQTCNTLGEEQLAELIDNLTGALCEMRDRKKQYDIK